MKVRVWIVSTCCPGESTPCWPMVFGTEKEAEAKADEMLRAEWDALAPESDDEMLGGDPLPIPYPGDWRKANSILAAEHWEGPDDRWGEWELTSHEIEISSLEVIEAANDMAP